jgi:hypothetical protein
MKKLAIAALTVAILAPALAAQTTLTGKWTGTMTRVGTDGGGSIELNLVQKGKVLTGTGGPNADQQMQIDKGAVNGSKITFQVQQPNGPLFTFTLTVEKGHLVGDMVGVRGDEKREFKVDLTKAK